MSYTTMSGKKRVRVDAKEAPLSLGTFFSGTSIYRNRLHSGEVFENGHVSIHNLVLENCQSSLITTFVAPKVSWLQQIFSPSTTLTIISGHDKQAPLVGHGAFQPILADFTKNWNIISCTPHSGGCLHCKLLLFRSNEGLRVVVSGNNFFQRQWEVDRDCLWIQDFYSITTNNTTTGLNNEFATTLASFVRDLARCENEREQTIVQSRIQSLFQGIDFSPAKARLVLSFPQPTTNSKNISTTERGGYEHLASVIHDVQSSLDSGSDREDNDDSDIDEYNNNNNNNSATIEEGSILYATSGSFGNVQPDFLLQMYQAFACGREVHAPTSTPWSAIFGKVKCLWPSRETALDMNLVSLIGNTRPIPRNYWRDSIPQQAKRIVFDDAHPNPSTKGTLEYFPVTHGKILYYASPQMTCVYVGSHNFSQAAWGVRGQSPKNIELGVVLATTSDSQRNEWKSCLPCTLPMAGSTSCPNYIPASAHSGIRQALEQGHVEQAVKMTREWLSRDEGEMLSEEDGNNAKQKETENDQQDPNIIKADVIDLCDSD